MNRLERIKEIIKASPDFGKRVGYKMCIVDELHDVKEQFEKEAIKYDAEHLRMGRGSRWYHNVTIRQAFLDGEKTGYYKGKEEAKDYDGVVTSVLEQNHQLTKAISLINRLSEYIVLSEDYWKKEDVEKQKEILREAEQFLKVVSE